MINELIPHIGDRLNFIEKYEKFSSQKKENVSFWANLFKYL